MGEKREEKKVETIRGDEKEGSDLGSKGQDGGRKDKGGEVFTLVKVRI